MCAQYFIIKYLNKAVIEHGKSKTFFIVSLKKIKTRLSLKKSKSKILIPKTEIEILQANYIEIEISKKYLSWK